MKQKLKCYFLLTLEGMLLFEYPVQKPCSNQQNNTELWSFLLDSNLIFHKYILSISNFWNCDVTCIHILQK